MDLADEFETGSGGFVWSNISANTLFSELRLHVYYAYYMQTDSSWTGTQFVNHYNRIYYVTEGEAVLEFDGFDIVMKPGHLYFIPPYSLKSHACAKHLSFYWVHFHALIDGDLDLFSLFAQPKEIKVDSVDKTLACLTQLTESVDAGEAQVAALLKRNMLLTELLLPFADDIVEQVKQQAMSGYMRFLPVLKYIQAHLSDTLSIKLLAEQMNMSAEHFSRSFKQQINIAPKRYILQKRISLAKQLLLLNNLSISEIADKTGYLDVYHFSKNFKQEVGLSPSKFKSKYK
ncbi:AraC family transcriptional regulator [Catenovulum adriaticum]|uniref:AraC family transcriptional regulator n=1 Tax=Catenovulum adriaticum TaxID=2984846 RepID=A0ABY7AS14_9ALTE|nr:AraC family transcriptional regulator [Catenovulum sp. TS8]WAJ72062.1 AraC family transcriptional regulator [Catenovulum sp. TS8]